MRDLKENPQAANALSDGMAQGNGALPRPVPGTWRFSRLLFASAAALLALLIAARLALPSVLHWAINRRLDQIPAYQGRVEDVHVALWRGAYTLRGVKIMKREGSKTRPFFAAREIDLSLAWRELFHRRVVGDIVIDDGWLNFIKARQPASSQLEVDRRWQDALKDIFPIDITYVKIKGGHVHYVDETADPKVDVYIDNMQALATGLRNRPSGTGEQFPATFSLAGDSIGRGRLHVFIRAEPLADQPHFELNLQLENVSLPALNDFLRAYGNVDVASGDFKAYLEVAAHGGRFEGYVKPFFTNVKFTDLAEKDVGQKIWQFLVSSFVHLFKNTPRDQLASRIPFSGQFGRTDVGVWASLTSMFHNGFVQALPAKLEHSMKSEKIHPAGGTGETSPGGGADTGHDQP